MLCPERGSLYQKKGDLNSRGVVGEAIGSAERNPLVLNEESLYLVLPTASAAPAVDLSESSDFRHRTSAYPRNEEMCVRTRGPLECGGKRSATPLWLVAGGVAKLWAVSGAKAPSPLRSAGALHKATAHVRMPQPSVE